MICIEVSNVRKLIATRAHMSKNHVSA
jgi:hypothetical protein